MTRIAFLGTGIMGLPMAVHVLQAGFDLTVWNRSPDKAASLLEQGAHLAAAPKEAAEGADVVILMLSTGSVCSQVLFEDGVADALAPGSTVIVMSSIPPDEAQDQAVRLAEKSIGYVDAPVSGGEKGAVDASLTIMAGGEAATVEAVTPVLNSMGRVTRVGAAGAGSLAKLANQAIVGISIAAVSEAFLLAREGGVDLAALRMALTGGFADSTILQQHGARMINGDFQPGAHATVQLKDMRTAREMADSLGLDLPVTQLLEQLYARMCDGPRATLDHSALFLELEEHMRRS